ncbi:MAG: N-acetylmuramoyl-L-alanine amidase [Bacteroidaceae bacterium]|nr:N-acetylmuramoyl-L-alanine amidase [Bacteroidaceae bacterium]
MKNLKSVKLIVIHCVANKCNKPFSTDLLIACGKAMYGQCSYHYYVRYDGSVIPLLPESVQGVHAKGYNHCSLGIVYEGGLDANGVAKDTRTEAQKHALYELLKSLTHDYPDARIVGHCELPHVAKDCPCFPASQEYQDLQPSSHSDRSAD